MTDEEHGALPPAVGLRRHVPLGLAILIAACCQYACGVAFGFADLTSHLTWWALAALVGLASVRLARHLFPSRHAGEFWVRVGVLSFALVVLCGLTLGSVGAIGRLPYFTTELALLVGAVLVGQRATPKRDAAFGLPPWAVGLSLAILIAVVGMGVSHAPFDAYDSLSYHLFFPARWLEAHRLGIIATPFSDEAQAYQPANGELWFLWLMIPFHGDFLARVGQLPFYGLGALLVYLLARRMGARPAAAAYAPVMFLITPTVVEQAVGANVDLIFATMFVASVYFGLVAVDADEWQDWLFWGITLGLFVGIKYLALVYLPLLLVVPFVGGLRPRVLWALPGLLLGAPWYVRNWIVAGSPIYPATLSAFGRVIAQGAYSRAAMAQSFMHTRDLGLLVVSLAHAFGATLALFLLPVLAVIVVALAARRGQRDGVVVLVAAVGGILLCWQGVGDNTDSRFVLASVALLASLVPLPFGDGRRLNAVLHVVYVAGVAWILIGVDRQIPVAEPWYMRDWLPLNGVLAPEFLLWFLPLVAVGALIARVRSSWRLPVAVGFVAAVGTTLAVGADRWCAPARCDFVHVPSEHLQLNYLYGARWLTSRVRGAHVAYTGINLPYPLSGDHLENVVYYVNIDHHAQWRFDDYARAFRRAGLDGPRPDALAAGSGVLMPMVANAGDFDAARPRFERMAGTPDAWTANLRALGITYVFVSTLDGYEVDYVWHNAQRFPIEDEWAKANPALFHLVYENPNVRIYQMAWG